MDKYVQTSIKGIFLLILAIAGNFLAETFSCKMQNLLTNNMLAKHCFGIIILYFTIDFTTSADPQTPASNFKLALIIYSLFLLFTKMNLVFTILVFSLLAAIYTVNSYINYYQKTDPKSTEIKKLMKRRTHMSIALLGFLLMGFILYFVKQRREHRKNWSTAKFIFGVTKCASA